MATPLHRGSSTNNVAAIHGDKSEGDPAVSDASLAAEGAETTTLANTTWKTNTASSIESVHTPMIGYVAPIEVADPPSSAPVPYVTPAAQTVNDNPIPKRSSRAGRPRSTILQGNVPKAEANAIHEVTRVASIVSPDGSPVAGSARATSSSQMFSTASEASLKPLQRASNKEDTVAAQVDVADSSAPSEHKDLGKFPLARRPTKKYLKALSRPETNMPTSPFATCNSSAILEEPIMVVEEFAESSDPKTTQSFDDQTCRVLGRGIDTAHSPLHSKSDKDGTDDNKGASRSVHARRLSHVSPTNSRRARPPRSEKMVPLPRNSTVGPLQGGTSSAVGRNNGLDAQTPMAGITKISLEVNDNRPLIQQASLRGAFLFWLAGFVRAMAGTMS